MATTKIGPKHQVTIPKEVFGLLKLEVGDLLDAQVESGKIVLTPKHLAEKAPAPRLSSKEQELLIIAKKKVERIRKDLRKAKGLTSEEAKIAAKVGLIAVDQIWWWTEDWQKGEREAEAELQNGKTKESFNNADNLIAHLREHAQSLKSSRQK